MPHRLIVALIVALAAACGAPPKTPAVTPPTGTTSDTGDAKTRHLGLQANGSLVLEKAVR